MSNNAELADPGPDTTTALQQRCEQLEREIVEVKQRAEAGLVKAHLRADAMRAGMIDMDGLKMIDTSPLSVTSDGEVDGAAVLMDRIRKEKPWLFGKISTSNPVAAPPAQPLRQKLATEMTDAEYKAARQEIIRQR